MTGRNVWLVGSMAAFVAACGPEALSTSPGSEPRQDDGVLCTVPTSQLTAALVPDAIPAQGVSLDLVPSIELRWNAWKRLHPETLVVSNDPDPDFDRGDYDVNVFENYERIDNPFVITPMELDPRRPPKERVLGIPASGDGGPAFPFEALRGAERRAISTLSGTVVVFWDEAAEAAVAFDTEVDGSRLSFVATETGYLDEETGTEWRLDGTATSGPLEGRRLDQVADAFVSFCFAWAAFFPETVVQERFGG